MEKEAQMPIDTPNLEGISLATHKEEIIEGKSSNQVAESKDEINFDELDFSEFSKYAISTSEPQKKQNRSIDEVYEINKLSSRFLELIMHKSFSPANDYNLYALLILEQSQAKFTSKSFSWKSEDVNWDTLKHFTQNNFNLLSHQFDFEMLDHKLFQKLFPMKVIVDLLSVVNREFGQRIYDGILFIQTNLIEILLYHHILPDTRFHPKIKTQDINLLDPFFRIAVRKQNSEDFMLKTKYFTSRFELKTFVLKLLELYFPNVTWRYIGEGHSMHKHIFTLIQTLFELGLYTEPEIYELANVLLPKLENLLTLEKCSFADFEGNLIGFPNFIKTLKSYFFDCRQLMASICVQIAVLVNDASLMESYPLFNTNLDINEVPKLKQSWRRAFFDNPSISNILNRIMMTYLFQFPEKIEPGDREDLFSYLNDLLLLTIDDEYDVFLSSSKVVTQEMIEFYYYPPPSSEVEKADQLKSLILNLVDRISVLNHKEKKEFAESTVLSTMKQFLLAIRETPAGSQRQFLKNLLGMRCVPNMILALITLTMECGSSKDTESACGQALVEICHGSAICQTCTMNEQSMAHWKYIFSSKLLSGLLLQTSLFEDDYHLFYAHKNQMKQFLDNTSKCILPKWSLKSADEKRVEVWFHEFKRSILEEGDAAELNSMVTFYIVCRFLTKMASTNSINYENKFYNLQLQNLMAPCFFGLFYQVITNPDFLLSCASQDPSGEGGLTSNPEKNQKKIKLATNIETSSPSELQELVEKASKKKITEQELRSIVFEVAMLTMKLLNKACSGLFQYWIYKYHIKDNIESLLSKTEYMLSIDDRGLEFRISVLLFFNNFRVFPYNHLITGRLKEFAVEEVSKESRMVFSITENAHTNIMRETQLVKELNLQKFTSDQIKYYLKYGLFPVIYKHIKGVYSAYTKDDYLYTVQYCITNLKSDLMQLKKVLKEKFQIELMGGPIDIRSAITLLTPNPDNQVAPLKKNEEQAKMRKRILDEEEKHSDTLITLRDDCEEIIELIEDVLKTGDSFKDINNYQLLASKCSSYSLIYATLTNPEPWRNRLQNDLHEGAYYHTASEFQTKANKMLGKALVRSTGLESRELRYFYSLIGLYSKKKKTFIGKPFSENIFLRFLESDICYAPNMLSFFTQLFERFYSEALNNDFQVDTIEIVQCCDNLLLIYLQNKILPSFVMFFAQVLPECKSLRDSLFATLSSGNKTQVELGMGVFTILTRLMWYFGAIALNKTFMDSEHFLISNHFERISTFIKNTCENNNQTFKKFLGTKSPKLRALNPFLEDGDSFVYELYRDIQGLIMSTNLHINTSTKLVITDRPETFRPLTFWIRCLSEMVNGPCLDNQKQIYTFRPDVFISIIRRNISNIDSSFYDFQNSVLEYILALLEGSNEEIVRFYASNFTFEIIFDLICSKLKKLYVVCRLNNEKGRYRRVALKARAHKLKKAEEVKKQEQQFKKYSDQEMEYYIKRSEQTKEKEDRQTAPILQDQNGLDEGEPYTGNTFDITEEIMDYYTIWNYKDIMEMYKKQEIFSSHIILQTVFSLNELLLKFADKVAGYKLCLDSIYCKMIDCYEEEVPLYIRNKLNNYEAKPTEQYNEKCAMYMFLSKITSEIEIAHPVSGSKLKVYFPLIPATFFLTTQTKQEFKYSADTDNMMVDLIQKYPTFVIEMQDNLELYRKWSIFFYLTSDDAFFNIKIILWILALTLNTILIIFYRRDYLSSRINAGGHIGLIVISIIIIIISGCSLFMWLFSRYMQKVKVTRELWAMENKSLRINPLIQFFQLYIYQNIIQREYPIIFIFHITSCLLGLLVEPFFYSLQVLTVVFIFKTMSYVVQSITMHVGALIQTVLLMLLVIYCYSVLSAEYFFDTLTSNQPGNSYYNCTQLWECLVYVFNNGLRNGGGIGDVTYSVNPLGNSGRYMSKFFFDIIFFMVINVISLNIIFGIIIDTFADMREKNDEKGRPM